MKVLLFGTGDFYRQYRHWFAEEDVVALLDNDAAKQGHILDGHRIVSPADGVRMAYDAVFLLSMYVRQMRAQLLSLGVPAEKIFGISDIGRFVQETVAKAEVQKFSSPCKAEKHRWRIAILSSDLRRNGASIAAMYAAEALAGEYDVTVLSATDGPLHEVLLAAGVDVWIAPILQVATMADVAWMQAFDLVFCNTFHWYRFLSRRDMRQPVIWWLHDPASFYEMTDHALLRQIDLEKLRILAVGPMARRAIHSFLPQAEVSDFLYGIPEVPLENRSPLPHERICFAVVGAVQPHKGQDLFLEAVRRLPGSLRAKAEFLIVGEDQTALAEILRNDANQLPEVHLLGEMDRASILALYRRIDVLVCSSREDTMPIVATEAMMFSHPCIASDHVGTCQYLHDGIDGVIYSVDDTQALADAMAAFIEHPERAAAMGQRARKIYEEVFALPKFQQRLRQLVKTICQVDVKKEDL